MNFQSLILALALAATGAKAQTNGLQFPVLVTAAGTFSNAHFGTIKRNYVTVLHDLGGTRVAMSNLPPWLQTQLGFPPGVAEAKMKAMATNRVQRNIDSSLMDAKLDTNSPVILVKQLAAVSKAMTGYFEETRDPITYILTIDQLELDQVAPGLKVELVCVERVGDQIPKTVSLLIHSESAGWRFAENHHLSVEAGTIKRDYGIPMDHASVVFDGVTEGFYLDWTLDELHDFAWADDFWFRLGTVECQVTPAQRAKWKLFWKYFDLMKRQQMASLGLRVDRNWSLRSTGTNAMLVFPELPAATTNQIAPAPAPANH